MCYKLVVIYVLLKLHVETNTINCASRRAPGWKLSGTVKLVPLVLRDEVNKRQQ